MEVAQGSNLGQSQFKTRPARSRACAHCARLKMKCQWADDGGLSAASKCDRCLRMNLGCDVPDGPRRRRGKSTRVAQLEQKIDSIMTLLATNSQGQTNHMPITPQSQLPHPLTPIDPELSPDKQPGPPPQTPHTATYVLTDFQITAQQASDYISIYKQDYAPNFPFVMIPPDATPHSVHHTSPALFWTVVTAVAPQSYTVQQSVKAWFRKHIAEHVLVRQEKTLHLLQAILVHLAWGAVRFYFRAEATDLVQIAFSLVLDMRLDKSPEASAATIRSLLGEAWVGVHQKWPEGLDRAHTLDEKRAVLGLYHISSIIPSLFKRGPQLAWSVYLSQCCDALLQSQEYESDDYLVAVVRVQQLVNTAYGILPTPGGQVTECVYTAAHEMAIQHIHSQVDDFVKAQPEMVQKNKLFLTLSRVLILRLHEPSLVMTPAPSDPLTTTSLQRIKSLANCLQAARESFQALLSVPAISVPSLPLTFTATIAFTIVTGCRLLLLELPEWRLDIARQELDLPAALQELSSLFEEADQCAVEKGRRRRLHGDEETCHYANRIHWIRQWYMSKVEDVNNMRSRTGFGTRNDLMAAEAGLWQADEPGLDAWPDLMALSDVGIQTFHVNNWPGI